MDIHTGYDSESDLILLGAGGHARVIADVIDLYQPQYRVVGFIDKDILKVGYRIDGIRVLGNDSIINDLIKKGLKKAFIAIGTTGCSNLRFDLYKYVKSLGFECINVIHGKSIIARNVKLGDGNAVLAGAIINIGVRIGSNCILNSGCIVEHDCNIGDNVHIASGAKIAGIVTIGNNCLIGIGASVIQQIHIGDNCIIGAGSVVIEDIPANSVAAGVPAKVVKTL